MISVCFKNEKKISWGQLFLALVFVTYPLRESFSIRLGPQSYLRFGEIIFFLSPLFSLLIKDYSLVRTNISKYIFFFSIYAIVFGFLLGTIVNSSYAFLFIGRSFFICSFIYIFDKLNIKIEQKFFSQLFKYIVVLEAFFFLLQFIGWNIVAMQIIPFSPDKVWGVTRLQGTASEPGYLVPIIAPCFYFFLVQWQNNKLFSCLSGLELILTFSSFAFFAFFVIVFLALCLKNNRLSIVKAINTLLVIFIAVFFMYVSSSKASFIIDNFTTKVLSSVIENQNEIDWSAAERNENKTVALAAFKKMPFEKQIFGMGLGATQYYTETGVKWYFPAQEAHCAYLAMLINIGVVGFALFLRIFFKLIKIKSKDVYSNALFCGVVIQILQFFIVGNIWLYFLWFNIGMIILIAKNKYSEEAFV